MGALGHLWFCVLTAQQHSQVLLREAIGGSTPPTIQEACLTICSSWSVSLDEAPPNQALIPIPEVVLWFVSWLRFSQWLCVQTSDLVAGIPCQAMCSLLSAVPEIIPGGGATFFFRRLHPQDTHRVRAPRPPGHVCALINPPHYRSNMPWPPGQVTPHPSDTLSTKHPPPTGQKSVCGPPPWR